MAVTLVSKTQIGATTWVLTWTRTGALTYIYYDARLAKTTDLLTATVEIAVGESLAIYLSDDPLDLPPPAFSGHVNLQWAADGGASYYTIEEYVDAEWVEKARVYSGAAGWCQKQTRYLEDETTHLMRIVPYTAAGVPGTAQEITIIMCRPPDAPGVAFTVDGSNRIVASVPT